MKSKFSLAALLLTPFMIAAQVSSDFKVPSFRLIQTDTFKFNNFVDCNMAAAWVGDTFRIFPGKYGEDPVWGDARVRRPFAAAVCAAALGRPSASSGGCGACRCLGLGGCAGGAGSHDERVGGGGGGGGGGGSRGG
ncbi:MAG: hypothetical protein ACKOCH_17285, partial [Bacteroidota bacterium]